MKFSNIALFASGALAVVLPRDLPAVITDIQSIISVVGTLDSAIKGFSGTSDVQGLLTASGNVVTAIRKANSDAGDIAAGSITTSTPGLNDLINGISDLVTAVNTVTGDLKSKRSSFADLGLCGQVLTEIQSQQSAAQTLQTTLISKITSTLQSTANSFAQQITDALASAANSYKSCPPALTSSTGPTSTTGPTSSAPTSSGVSVPTTGTTSCPETTTAVVPPAYTTSSTTSCPETTTTAVVPPPYTTAVVPPPYTITPIGTGSIPTPSTNGTAPPPSTPTVVPNTNGGAKAVAGFGGLVMAVAAAAIAL